MVQHVPLCMQVCLGSYVRIVELKTVILLSFNLSYDGITVIAFLIWRVLDGEDLLPIRYFTSIIPIIINFVNFLYSALRPGGVS